MNVEIHIHNIKSQIVVRDETGKPGPFPSTFDSKGKPIPHPVVGALDKELCYYVDMMIGFQMRSVPVKRFSTKTYKFDTGCVSYVGKILRTFDIAFIVVDKRIPTPPGKEIPVREGVVFRPYQQEAIEAAFKAQRGVLKLATGAGKTMIAGGLIAKLNLKTVVFVHTIDLLEQFKESLEFTLNMEIGQIGGGVVDPKHITVCMMQTVVRSFSEKYVQYELDPSVDEDTEESQAYTQNQQALIRNTVESAQVVISDECFAAGTLVTDGNGVPRPIESFKNSDRVLSYDTAFSNEEISHAFSRTSLDNVQIITASTIHKTSANHKWWVYDSLTKSLQKRASKDLKIDDYLLSVRTIEHKVLNEFSFEQAQFLALIACDGHSEKNSHTIKIEVSKDVEYFRSAVLSAYSIKPVSIVERSSRRCLENSNWNNTIVFSFYDSDVQNWLERHGVPRGNKSAIIDIPDIIFNAPLASVSKYLNTVYCCEGSIGERRISLQMTSEVFIKKIQLLLLRFGIQTKYQRLDYRKWNTKHKYDTKIHYRIDICDFASLMLFKQHVGFDIERKQVQLDFLISTYTSKKEEILGHSLVCSYIQSFGVSLVSMWEKYKIPIRYPKQNKRDVISVSVLTKILQVFDSYPHSSCQFEMRTLIKHLMTYCFDRVRSVTRTSEPMEVYDFTVANTHKFIAQTNITSNCHHLSCTTLQTLFKKANNAFYRYGLTATLREDGADLVIYGVTGKIVYEVSASFLIEHNPPYLVRPIIYYMKVPRPKQGGGKYQQRYASDIVENKERNALVVQSTMRLVKKGYRVLILAQQIKHLKIIKGMIEDGYDESIWPDLKDYDSRTIQHELATGQVNKVDRKRIIESMRRGQLECMLASTIADEGLDCPPISAVILAGGGKSATKAFQRVGRALRLYPGKTQAVIIDFFDQGKYFKKHAEKRMELFQREPAFILKIEP